MLDLLPVEIVTIHIIPKLSLQESFRMVATCKDLWNLRYDPSIIAKYSLLDLMEYRDMHKLGKRLVQIIEKYGVDENGNIPIPKGDYIEMMTTFYLSLKYACDVEIYHLVRSDRTIISFHIASPNNKRLKPVVTLKLHDILNYMFYWCEVAFSEIMRTVRLLRLLELDTMTEMCFGFAGMRSNSLTYDHYSYWYYEEKLLRAHNKLSYEERMQLVPYLTDLEVCNLLKLETPPTMTSLDYELEVVAICTAKLAEMDDNNQTNIKQQACYRLLMYIIINTTNAIEYIRYVCDSVEITLHAGFKFYLIDNISQEKYIDVLVLLIQRLPLTSSDSVLQDELFRYRVLDDKKSSVFRRALKLAAAT